MFTLACPHCGETLPRPSDVTAGNSRCPSCGKTIVDDRNAETIDSRPVDPAVEPTITQFEGVNSAPARDEPGLGIAIAGYTIESELGRGGMGVVYRARETILNRVVAIKILLSGAHAGTRDLARFRAEAEAVAAIEHPNVVHVYAVGQHGGLPFMALEFVPGGTLADRLANGPLVPETAARLVQSIARGVQAAHKGGVVHRDLKPANILFSAIDEPKVADFGLAKRDDSGLTASGAIMGTPAYMAPEQASGDTKAAGPAVDIWALGIILYECISGRQPFRGRSALETMRLVSEADPPALRGVPRDLATITFKCLEKDPSRRYASAKDVADELGRFLSGEAVSARGRSRIGSMRSWLRQHPRVSYSALGAILAAIVSLIVFARGPKEVPQPEPDAETKLPSEFAFIPPDAPAFISLRPNDILVRPDLHRLTMVLFNRGREEIDEATVNQEIERAIGIRPADIDRVTLVSLTERALDEPGSLDMLMIVRTRIEPNFPIIRERMEEFLGSFVVEEHRGKRLYTVKVGRDELFALWRATGRDFMFGPVADVRAAVERSENPSSENASNSSLDLGPTNSTLVGRSKSFGQFLRLLQIDPTPELEELGPILSSAGPIRLSLDALPPANENGMPGLNFEARIHFPDAQRAEEGALGLRKLMKRGLKRFEGDMESRGVDALKSGFQKAIQDANVRQDGSDVRVSIQPRWSEEEIKRYREQPRMTTDQKLRQIALAMHNYEATFGRLPFATTTNKAGKPLYSWRVELLPYLEHDHLYREFKREEAWDHPSNKKLLEQMPEVFQMDVSDPDFAKERTRFQVIQAKNGIFDGTNPTRLGEITDGTANTLLVVEAGTPIEWTAPDALRMDAKGPMPKLGNPQNRECWILLGDGDRKRISREPPLNAFWPLLTKTGGDSVNWDRLRGNRK